MNNDNMCFACGKKNPISLKLDFKFRDEQKDIVQAKFTPDKLHQGYDGIMHGGLVSTLLDEAMAKVINMQGIKALTAEIKVRFKEAVKINNTYQIRGIIEEKRKRLVRTRASLQDEQGKIYAAAEGKFLIV